MNHEYPMPIYMLYDGAQAFEDRLDAAIDNARTDDEQDRLSAIAFLYGDEGEEAALDEDQHDLIERLARERHAIGPTDV